MSELPPDPDPNELDKQLTDLANTFLFGENWREDTPESEAKLEETGCDFPRYCKFYGRFPDFCDRSCDWDGLF